MSITYLGAYLLTALATYLQVEIATTDLEAAGRVLGTLVVGAVIAYGRWRKGDLTVLGLRK